MYQNAQRTCRAIVFAYKIESNCEVLVVAVVVPLRSKPRKFLHEKKIVVWSGYPQNFLNKPSDTHYIPSTEMVFQTFFIIFRNLVDGKKPTPCANETILQ